MKAIGLKTRNVLIALLFSVVCAGALCLQPAYAETQGDLEQKPQAEELVIAEDGGTAEDEAAALEDEATLEDADPAADPDANSDELKPVEGADLFKDAEPAGDANQPEAEDAETASDSDAQMSIQAADAELATQASTASLSYSAHVQRQGWQSPVSTGQTSGTTGKALRLEGLKITISGVPSGSVVYQAHVQRLGWQDAVADGRLAGTTGQALRIEALRIWLSGAAADQYDILYRAHVQGIGWQGWVMDGAVAGTTGQSKRLEAIEIKLSEKTPNTASATPGVSYQAHVQTYGWQDTKSNGATAGTTGQSKRVEALKITLNTGNFTGGIEYQAHVQSIGWQDWVKSGTLVGTTGQAKRIEALRIKLTGDIANKFDVRYRVHVQSIGWQPWVYNGMGAGTTGQSKRVEAVEIELVNKATKTGWEGSGSTWSYIENGVKTSERWVVTDVAPMDEFNFEKQRYWIDNSGTMAVSRYVDPSSARDKKAGYAAYAMEKGYVLRGKRTMSDGVLLADNDGRIPTNAGWLTTSAYDGTSQKYYLVKSGVAALAKTGLFTVDGAKYYGMPGEGYVMCSGHWHLDGSWYSAASDGKLTLDTGGITSYIERYISWAIATARDDSHGYSQANRWGPDYDCSSFVVSSLKNSGFMVGEASWTGNMVSELTKYGFKWYSNLALRQRGDLMFVHNDSHQHTEIFLGNNQIVGATSSENGGKYGQAGDQTGREIRVGTYYNMPWDGFLRYTG